MIDINLLRADKGGNPDLVRESQRKRGGDAKVLIVDQVLTLDDEWKKGVLSIPDDMISYCRMRRFIQEVSCWTSTDDAQMLQEKALHSKLRLIGNIVHESVVVSDDEKDNLVVEKWWPEGRTEAGEMDRRAQLIKDGKGVTGLFSHHEVLEKIGGYDPVRGANVAGHRGYFLTGPGVDLNLALMHYGLDFLEKRGYTKLWTPFFMKREVMAKTAQLEEFDEALYSVEGEAGDAKYLIATSEQPISAFHAGEWFSDASELPKKYAGSSTCFRKEAGAHGRDTWGIFRLGLPYHIISIVSGALNNAAAKKYDLEAWFPFQGTYKELVSCSNCTDYQCRELEMRFGTKKMNDSTKQYVHALNCTLTATERTICCILENFQTETGVVVPEPLRNYMGGKNSCPL
ncbi:hypothetical protein BSLG_001815 [Batrachochytrium salamandrivorans]|nr:hypothetical protein BSLG_001815 [Batrachochytrium salamandrivorans]